MHYKNRNRVGLLASGAVAILLTALLASPTFASLESPDQAVSSNFYRVSVSPKASVADVVEYAHRTGVRVTSIRHGDASSSGEMLVGNEPLEVAAAKYVELTISNFGVEPAVNSFTITTPVDPSIPVGEGVATVEAVTHGSFVPLLPVPSDSPRGTGQAWAPSSGTTYAHNSSTGSARRIRHRLTWTSQAGLNSYGPSYVYEHDNKLIDSSSQPSTTGGNVCTETAAYWVAAVSTKIVTTDLPTSSNPYADNARYTERCGYYDISFGIFHPGKLTANRTYTVVIGADAGPKASSPQQMRGQVLKNDCPSFAEYDDCVGLNTYDGGQDTTPLYLGTARRFPGCYSWSLGGTPIDGQC